MNADLVNKATRPEDAPLGDAWGEDDSSHFTDSASKDDPPVDIGRMIAANTDCC